MLRPRTHPRASTHLHAYTRPRTPAGPGGHRSRWTALAALGTALVLVTAGTGNAAGTAATPAPGWATGTLTDNDLHSLVAQMSLPEEIGMVHGGPDTTCATTLPLGCVGQAGWIPGVERLGIPPLRMTDGPAGIRLGHVETALPAPVGLAATFDRAAALDFGTTVGRAGRATGQDVWLAPMVNAVYFPTAGRNFETLGEDPYLAGELAAQEVTGVQREGLVAELKHYIENDFENGRSSSSVSIDDQTLHETELLAFAAGIRAGAGSVMCSYNRINDVYGCGNSDMLQQVLREQLAFTGFVQSDWGAVHRVYDLPNGTDIEQPSARNFTSTALTDAVTFGTPAVAASADYPAYPAISAAGWQQALDTAVFHILVTMNKAGLLEGTAYGSRFTGTPQPYVPPRGDLAGLRATEAQTARTMAEDGATLLRNERNTLPIRQGDLVRDNDAGGVVVMGPTAIAAYTGGGGSAHVTPYDAVTSPYDALRAAAGPDAHLSYAPGYNIDGVPVPSTALAAPDPAAADPHWTLTDADAAFAGQPGLLRQQITTAPVASGSQPVLYAGPDAVPDRLDATVDTTVDSAGTVHNGGTLPTGTAWRWTGTLTAPENPGGTGWQLKVFVANQASSQLFLDGLTTASRRVNIGGYPAAPSSSYAGLGESAKSHDPAHPTLQQATYSATLTPGQRLDVDLRVVTGTVAPAQVQLRWVPPDLAATSIADAVAAARSASKAVIFAYDEGTEGSDRGGPNQAAGLALPGYQDALISAVAAANPDTVVVLNTGDPVLMPWAADVASILEMWYPGQEGGRATADVLLGNANPGGHLPVTFPADARTPMYDPSCTDTSPAGNCPLYPGVVGPSPFLPGATTSYRTVTGMKVNGIYEGYRWYEQHHVAPLYPFGYGLSYTKFDYSKLTVVSTPDGGLDVSFRVRNVGDRAGSSVPQVYLGRSPDLPASIAQAPSKLVQFDRVRLEPGHAADLTLHVTPLELSSWSTAGQRWVVGTGARTVWLGSSSRDPLLSTTVTIG